MSTTSVAARPQVTSAGVPTSLLISAWAVPILVVGQFAMLAIIPVVVILFGAFRGSRILRLRWAAGLLAAVYAAPLAVWALREDGAQSLSKDIHPVFVGLIVAASVAVLVSVKTRRH